MTERLQQKAEQAVNQESASLDATLRTYTDDIEKPVKNAQDTIGSAIDQFAVSMDQKVTSVAKQNAIWASKAAEASETVHEARMDWLSGSVTLIALPMIVGAIAAMVGSLLATAIILAWALETPDDLSERMVPCFNSPGVSQAKQGQRPFAILVGGYIVLEPTTRFNGSPEGSG
ncbi:hypothetical protein [uncultured Tateyamaria sp.]|uniref:hypothetical protein n=1 Tax=uncultured Tateyamaria sp. TaxID=455651 RepID=UPI00260BFAEF|nr:hypothetical protein [uncultured Tateyamaria sp.]